MSVGQEKNVSTPPSLFSLEDPPVTVFFRHGRFEWSRGTSAIRPRASRACRGVNTFGSIFFSCSSGEVS